MLTKQVVMLYHHCGDLVKYTDGNGSILKRHEYMKNILAVMLIVVSFGVVKPQCLNISVKGAGSLLATLDVCSNDSLDLVSDNYVDSFCEGIFSSEILEDVASYFPSDRHGYKFIQSSISDKPPRQYSFLV
ncbi:MAG: hypothetical protein HQL05_15725 [Nitrospirae bacterium]|uniref:hypothetical protein n=1 Tax=Candidatus Magnetobacterium casense TaxID=1455061 RepID=UPI00058DD506|nr:hypothetical protein [Candidatus Magnetobacterium casensis]MBF0339268.1 hypothetical protein [Nitrospirota bacterium]